MLNEKEIIDDIVSTIEPFRIGSAYAISDSTLRLILALAVTRGGRLALQDLREARNV